MSQLKLNRNDFEIVYMKNKRVFITLFVLAILVVTLLSIWSLYIFGFIFNQSTQLIKYNIENIDKQEISSVFSNSEIKTALDGNILINKSNSFSLAGLLNKESKPIALSEVIDGKITFSDNHTFATLILHSPYFLNLSKSLKNTLYKKILKDNQNLNVKFDLENISKDLTYKEMLDKLVEKEEYQQFTIENYKQIYTNNLPGFVTYNNESKYNWNMDNYRNNFPSKFFNKLGLQINSVNNKIKMFNYSTFYQNIKLTTVDNKEFKTLSQTFKPTFLNPLENIDEKLFEDLDINSSTDDKILQYKINSSQINSGGNNESAVIYNYRDYINNLYQDFNISGVKSKKIDNIELYNKYIKHCGVNLINTSCVSASLSNNIDIFTSNENNKLLNINKLVFKNALLDQINIVTKFYGIYKTSPEASFLYFLNNTQTVTGDLNLRPYIAVKTDPLVKVNISYDGSFDLVSEESKEGLLNLTFNKQDYLINITIKQPESKDYFCTSDLDLIKLENTLYKSQGPKWNQGNLELLNTINYYKTDSALISNLKVETKNGLYQVNEAEGQLFKNCFNSPQLESNYLGFLVKINASKIDLKPILPDQFADIDQFVKSLVFEKTQKKN